MGKKEERFYVFFRFLQFYSLLHLLINADLEILRVAPAVLVALQYVFFGLPIEPLAVTLKPFILANCRFTVNIPIVITDDYDVY